MALRLSIELWNGRFQQPVSRLDIVGVRLAGVRPLLDCNQMANGLSATMIGLVSGSAMGRLACKLC